MLGQSGGTVALTPELFDKKCGILAIISLITKFGTSFRYNISKNLICVFFLGRENPVLMISVSKNGLKKATFDNFGITIEVLKVNKMTFFIFEMHSSLNSDIFSHKKCLNWSINKKDKDTFIILCLNSALPTNLITFKIIYMKFVPHDLVAWYCITSWG